MNWHKIKGRDWAFLSIYAGTVLVGIFLVFDYATSGHKWLSLCWLVYALGFLMAGVNEARRLMRRR